jgi:hypothetical protein
VSTRPSGTANTNHSVDKKYKLTIQLNQLLYVAHLVQEIPLITKPLLVEWFSLFTMAMVFSDNFSQWLYWLVARHAYLFNHNHLTQSLSS